MAENKTTELTSRRKKLIYSLIVAISVLMIATATALTIYFVTKADDHILDNPPPVENPDDKDPEKPDDNEPSKPSEGDNTVKFVSPLGDSKVCTVEYNAIYTNQTLNRIYRHRGVDFTADEGVDVLAIADGKVTDVSLSEELGNVITIDHGDGLVSVYRFVEPVSDLNAGDTVRQGAKIGTVAKAYGTEASDGTHLHLEIELSGKGVDPADYFEITYEEK